jgi:ribosome-binding factor A
MSKPSYPRSRRVNAIIQEVLAEEIERLTDPRLGLVTVTGVDAAPDMRHATVFVSTIEVDRIDDSLKGLAAAAPRLRAALGREIRTKYTPELEFKADMGVIQGERIEAILRKLGDENAVAPVMENLMPEAGEDRA